MLSNFTKHLSYLLFGLLVGFVFYPVIDKVSDPVPYDMVQIREVDWTEEGVVLRATFRKNGDCSLKSFAVVGFVGDIPSYVSFVDLDGIEDNFDREEGHHGFNILIDITPDEYDAFEVRTRHECRIDKKDTEIVNRVFTRQEY